MHLPTHLKQIKQMGCLSTHELMSSCSDPAHVLLDLVHLVSPHGGSPHQTTLTTYLPQNLALPQSA